jgi:hypothetical protein
VRARRALGAAVLVAGVLLSGTLGADEAHWRDFESRIQYGYYTEDQRGLHNIQDALAQQDSREPLHAYYAALADWRLAQLSALSSAAGSTTASLAQRCVKELDALLAAQADFVEALALRAACAASETGLHVPFGGPKPHKDLERALELAPHNPRVLFIDALSDEPPAGGSGGNRERALTKLRQAVAAFEAERAGAEPLPAWGAAEAYLALGRNLLQHGDAVAARDALEHALLLAPEYAPARRLMAKIATG